MHILCVHTEDRPDREENVAKQAEKYGLEIEIVEFERDKESPMRGCCTSHQAIIEMAKQRDLDEVMIIENDVCFEEDPLQYASGPPGLPANMLYLGGTLSRIYFEEPTRLEGSDTVGLLTVKPTHTFLDLDKLIKSRRQDVLVLTMDESPDSAFETFGATDCSNAYIVSGEFAGESDIIATRQQVKGVRFAKDLYHRAKITDCFREQSSQLIGVANIAAIVSRLQEIIFMPAVHVPHSVDSQEIFDCEWELLGRSAEQRRLWLPSTCLSTHCYVLKRDTYSRAIDLLAANVDRPLEDIQPVDVVYQTQLHPTIQCYSLLKPVASQVPSFSDIEARAVDYRKLHMYNRPPQYPVAYERKSIPKARVRNEGRTLCLDRVDPEDLPRVSVITVTRNHRRLFALPVNNFMNFDYPKDKLEWVIVDDSEVGHDAKPALGALRSDKRVRFVRLRTKDSRALTIGRKRHIGCENATGDVFLHMDDDDLVPSYAITARVKSLLTYDAECVGSTNILCYDISTSELYNWPSADAFGDRTILPEAGLAYTKRFWKEKGWEDVHFEEGKAFLHERDLNKIVDIPSQ
ncbi:hypothetical protein KFL_011700040, partial [Klebsormidium nitens]